ncbi:MAG: transcription-repair coupling factor, partial [Hyphomicrobiales bacterium]|nr:transcription-repair coupling factor [Hyphomicrobiales bacterium]
MTPHYKIDWLTGAPEGVDALTLGRMALAEAVRTGQAPLLVHVARDDRRLEQLAAAIAFFTPAVKTLALPAWDTVPYDRIGPNAEIVARRITTLSRLALSVQRKEPTILLTTANAIIQRLPPRDFLRASLRPLEGGQRLEMERLAQRLVHSGYQRTGTVMEAGEFAVRGGILDVYPPGRQNPVRLDFFGDTLESIRAFDPESQRSQKTVPKLVLMPISEVAFGEEAEKRFRQRYVECFGPVTGDDPLYQAISSGQRYPGMEHWLPLFHDTVETLFDYVGDAPLSFDHQVDRAMADRHAQIADHYKARVDGLETEAFGAAAYKPVPPDQIFLSERAWQHALAKRTVRQFTPFEQAEGGGASVTSMGGRTGRSFHTERASAEPVSVFDLVRGHIRDQQAKARRVVITAWTPGARERLTQLLKDHGIAAEELARVETMTEAEALPIRTVAMGVLGMEHGFETLDLVVIGEQDILGDRLVRPRRKARKAADVITEA